MMFYGIWNYKDNRKSTPKKIAVTDSWRRQQPLAIALLLHMGVIQMRAVDAAADDLAGRLCMDQDAFADYGIERITMVSGDTDWWQAISERVDWFTPITDKTMSLDLLRTDAAKDGPFESPDEYLLAKSVAGDSSDNIPGVPGVGIATAVKLLRLHGGLAGIRRAVESGQAKDKKSAAISLPTEMSRMLWIRKLFSKKPKIAIAHSLNSRCGGSFGIHSLLN